jgi:hypothetical protein
LFDVAVGGFHCQAARQKVIARIAGFHADDFAARTQIINIFA